MDLAIWRIFRPKIGPVALSEEQKAGDIQTFRGFFPLASGIGMLGIVYVLRV